MTGLYIFLGIILFILAVLMIPVHVAADYKEEFSLKIIKRSAHKTLLFFLKYSSNKIFQFSKYIFLSIFTHFIV